MPVAATVDPTAPVRSNEALPERSLVVTYRTNWISG
jgi:hypothetical protein